MNLVKKILSFVWRLFRIVLAVAVILVAAFIITVDQMLPRQIITFVIPILVVTGIILTFALMKWRVHIPINVPKGRNLDDRILSCVYRHKIRTCLIVLAFFAIISLPRVISDQFDKGLLNNSVKHFSVVATPTVTEKRINLTRIELEKSLRKINSSAGISIDDPIKVYLFSNTSELQKATGSPEWIGGLAHWSPQGVEIFLPAELPPDEKSILNEGAPVHELTHAIEALLTKNPTALPLWIREGLANQYLNFWERVLTHVGVWLDRDKIMSYERLSLYRYEYPKEKLERSLFYSNSYEFVRYLFMRYGESTIWGIVREVGAGESYERVVSHATGISEGELYQDWLREWLQGWQVGEWRTLIEQY